MPDSVEARQLDKGARVELKTLSKDNADWVARHLVMVSQLIEEDPELAHRHALSAARRAGRIGVVRETLAITAYATGDFALALRELRTYRRITGLNDQLALMVDSERGVGRPDRALELGRSVDRATLPVDVQVSLAIAMSGARLDLGQAEAALAELEIPQLDPNRAFSWSPDLFHAYAEVLEDLGREEQAASWRERALRAEEALAEANAEDELETVHIVEEELEGDFGADEGFSVEDEVAELLGEGDEADGSVDAVGLDAPESADVVSADDNGEAGSAVGSVDALPVDEVEDHAPGDSVEVLPVDEAVGQGDAGEAAEDRVAGGVDDVAEARPAANVVAHDGGVDAAEAQPVERVADVAEGPSVEASGTGAAEPVTAAIPAAETPEAGEPATASTPAADAPEVVEPAAETVATPVVREDASTASTPSAADTPTAPTPTLKGTTADGAVPTED